MYLEFHDDRVNDPVSPKQRTATHCATACDLDYDYQGEQHVIDSGKEYIVHVKWILFDDEGARALWKRVNGKPALVAKAERFTGACVPAEGWTVIPVGVRDL